MMASAGPPSGSSLLPLLESLEDGSAEQSEQTDAYLTIANRLSGEEGRQFLPAVEKHFSRLGKATLSHITSPNAELSQAALQALGFCLYHSHVVSGVPETLPSEILSALCSLVVKSTDKNTCTRALWVISKQSFPPDVVGKKVSSILSTLESVWSREDVHSVVMEHEALNVIIRLLEQAPAQMGEGTVRWAKLVIPLVVHSASKVRLRAAAAMELGMPLLLHRQTEVAAIIEPMMSTKLIPELQKLFMSKNETNVLKLWPLFVKLLGKMLHRGGPFINSLLHLEELGFRSTSPPIKKIAFIAWKSLIDNFALNPDILCSSKRMKLLMQPLASIHVRTEALLLTKVEVWWYLCVQLRANLSPNFDMVSVPLLQCCIGSDSPLVPGTPSRAVSQNGAVTPGTPKTGGTPGFNSSANSSRLSLNSSGLSSSSSPSSFPSVQLIGLEMLLHYFLGPDVIATAAKNKLVLNLEPLTHPLLSGTSSFTKHAAVLTSNIREGFTNIGKEAPDALLSVIWTSLVRFVNLTIESGSKKERQGSEVLTLMLQALQTLVTSEALPADKVMILFEATVRGIPQRVLGSASYQVGKMDVLNGTPALFLILLLYNSSMLPAFIEDERFFQCLQTLVGCGLSGPTSPLAFGEAVLVAMGRTATTLQNKEQLWRMWSAMVTPLTDTITQTNEVNQGDALEHNFSAMHSALLFPATHLLRGTPLQQASQKSMLWTWSKLYTVFARCSALVATAEENICCEELCAKMAAAIDREALTVPSTLNAVSSILQVMVESVDFSPYTPQFEQKLKSPHTPMNWMRKRNKVLGNLSTFQSLLVQCLDVYLESPDGPCEGTGLALVAILSTLFTNLVLSNTVQEALATLLKPITLLYTRAASNPGTFTLQLLGKLEKLLGEVLCCLQTRSSLAYDTELLTLLSPLLCVLFPHNNKHLRTSVTQFWNGTFANSVSLTYPEEIRPILNQVKQNTPIILPGFEAFAVPDEFSGPYPSDLSENSQLETNFSGMPVSSVGMRDSMLGKTPEMKDRSSIKTSKPVSTKLDFGSPKPSPRPPRRGVLEEEASVDFVFIPPETKERVLTEHQKEVKRTKRVDIPAMYNNLDASMDTTVFSQYTQSQEDSMDTLPTHEANKVTKDSPAKVPQEDVEKDEDIEVLTKDTQDFASPQAVEDMTENHEQEVEQMIPESTDVSMEEDTKSYVEAEDLDSQPKEGTSPNVSGSSDLITGTPQKANSRRQSFITLEKYPEGMSASPSTASFTSTLIKTPKSQERSKPRTSSRGSRKSNSTSSQNSQSSQAEKTNSQCSVKDAPESPLRPKYATKCEPVRLTERLPSEQSTEDEDVIPDTQTEAEDNESTTMASSSDEVQHSSQEEDSQPNLDDSQSSSSGGEPRRSGRQRVRPKLPGEDPEEREEKYTPLKKRRSGEEPKSDSPKSSPVQTRPNTRSKNSAEEDSGKEGLRTRSRRDKGDSSQTNSLGRRSKKIKLFSNSEEFLGSPEPRRRSTRDFESTSQTDTQSDQESQSKGRPVRPRKSPVDPKEDKGTKKVVLPDKKESSQTASLELVDQADKDDDQPKKDSQIITPSPQSGSKSREQDLVEQMEQDSDALKTEDSEMVIASPQIATTPETAGKSQEVVEQVEKDAEEPRDSDMVISSPQVPVEPIEKYGDKLERDSQKDISSPQVCTPSQTDSKSQESELVETTKEEKTDSPKVDSSQTSDDSQGRPRTAKKLVKESQVKDKLDTKEVKDDNLSQDDSQVMTPSDSQSLRRSRRSKTDSQDSSENKEPSGRQSSSNSQGSLPAAGQTEAKIEGRGRRSKAQEEQSKSSPISTPKSSRSLDLTGSTESPKGRGKFVRRSSLQMLLATAESSGSESSEARKSAPMPKRRGKKPKASQQSPLALEPSKAEKINKDTVKDNSENTQMEDTQNVEATITADVEDSQLTQDLQDSESVKVTPNVEEQSNVESQMEVDVDTVNKQTEAEDTKESKSLSTSPLKDDQTQNDSLTKTMMDNTPSQESDTGDMQTVETVEPVEIVTKETQETLPSEPSILPAVDALVSPDEAIEKLQVSESSEEKVEDVCELVDNVTEEQNDTSDTNHQECPDSNVQELPLVPSENTSEECPSTSLEENQMESPNVPEEISKEEEEEESASIKEDISTNQEAEVSAVDDITPLEENYKDGDTQILECQNEEKTDTANIENDEVFEANLDAPLTDACDPSVLSESTSNDVLQGSPAKQKDLEALMGLDLGQSPSSSSSGGGGRTRGTWSPSASPSTSILKKGQKRPLEDDTPSPLVKSGEKFRRVSFANPIQHQEIADDIDRRSPAIRTSSPRRSRVSGQTGIPGPKYVTTPTKGLIFLSPRNLHSPGYKSSKKCLISEMGQEPRPISKDCIYPSLVGCSTPVEAVLPQISSNMWSRGFGQLVRARNIKTVGDLSALTPTEIKTLPIRSPKISNVKKALKIYEQQRKGRGVDELKSFDEMEMMTSEPGVHDEEDKTSVETLATALVDEPVLADGKADQDIIPGIQTLDTSVGEQTPGGLLSDMEALTCRMTPLELSHCNSQQLVDIHDQLGGMMRKVVVEMQTRLTHTEGKP